jgi:hypothetical protein
MFICGVVLIGAMPQALNRPYGCSTLSQGSAAFGSAFAFATNPYGGFDVAAFVVACWQCISCTDGLPGH